MKDRVLRPESLPEKIAMGTPLATAAWADHRGNPLQHWSRADFRLGRNDSVGDVGISNDQHILVCSGTRGGKGTSVIIPNLCSWTGSVVVIDPKGENAIVTARRRGRGSAWCRPWNQPVRILDPFGEVARADDDFRDLKVSFNPLDLIRIDREESIDEAARIADALVSGENSADPFWEESARALIRTLILHVASAKSFRQEERNLLTVRALIQEGDEAAAKLAKLNAGKKKPPNGMMLLFAAMKRNPAFNGVVARAGAKFTNLLKNSAKTFESVLQVAATNTDFLESPAMKRCLARSDFQLDELKTAARGSSLYLCLPQRYMDTHYRWLRMMIVLTLGEMERVKQKAACGQQVLMILDEFPALRRMRAVETAAAQIAGHGVKMLFVTQTLAQLKDIYKDNWETLLGNAGTKLFFCNDDHFTREHVSKLIGECEVSRFGRSMNVTEGKSNGGSRSTNSGSSTSQSLSQSANNVTRSESRSGSYGTSETESWSNSHSDSRGFSESVQKRPLLTPDEVGRLFGDRSNPQMLALVSGHQPVSVRREVYYRKNSLLSFYDPHPLHPYPLKLTESLPLIAERERREGEEKRQREAKRQAEAGAQARAEAEKHMEAQRRERIRCEEMALRASRNAEAQLQAAERERIRQRRGLAICVTLHALAAVLFMQYWPFELSAPRYIFLPPWLFN